MFVGRVPASVRQCAGGGELCMVCVPSPSRDSIMRCRVALCTARKQYSGGLLRKVDQTLPWPAGLSYAEWNERKKDELLSIAFNL